MLSRSGAAREPLSLDGPSSAAQVSTRPGSPGVRTLGGNDMNSKPADELFSKAVAASAATESSNGLASRRDLLMAPLLAAIPLALLTERAGAAPDPNMTIVKSPEDLTWVDMFNSGEGAKIYAAGGKIVSSANLYGETSKPGILLRSDQMVSWLHERPTLV